MVHEAATVEGEEEEQEKVIIVNDVSRAFVEAKAIRKLCVELPSECPESCVGYNVGLLKQSLYGTRDAAMNWQEEVAKEMKGWGFERGQYNPCLYTNVAKKVQVFLHGDDFASVGTRVALKWFLQKLESRFEIKTSVIGTGIGEVREARVLNRILRITEHGREYESGRGRKTTKSSMPISKSTSGVSRRVVTTSRRIDPTSCSRLSAFADRWLRPLSVLGRS